MISLSSSSISIEVLGSRPELGSSQKVPGVQSYRSGYGYALLHTARYLGGILALGSLEANTLEAEHGTLPHLGTTLSREHHQREHHIAEHRFAVKQRRTLKEHAYFFAKLLYLTVLHAQQIASVEEYLPFFGSQQAYERFHQHGLARAALPYDKIGLAGIKGRIHAVKHGAAVERFCEGFYFNHCSSSLVRITSKSRMKILLLTTPLVLALPTSSAPPFT